MIGLGEQVNNAINWQLYEVADGSAARIGASLRSLLSATEPSETKDAYWQLENHIVVQGMVYSSALPTVHVLVAALADSRPFHVRVAILELLYQILSGAPASVGADSLIANCRQRAKEGLWLLIKEFASGPRDAAREVLVLLDVDVDYERIF